MSSEQDLTACVDKAAGYIRTLITSSALPTGAATEATLSAIFSAITSALNVHVSLSVLPTGASTEATQVKVLEGLVASGAGKVTEVAISNTTWTALPATPLTNRNVLTIQNPQATAQDIKVNYDNTVSGYVGLIILPGSERFYSVTPGVIIYAKSATSSCTLNIEELS